MSHLSTALTEILDRMKTESGKTRQQYALDIGMPLSSFMSYVNGISEPGDSKVVSQLVSAMLEPDATRCIISHLLDNTPEEWRDRIGVTASLNSGGAVSLEQLQFLPTRFKRQIEAIIAEAPSNEHIVGFIDEFATLMGWTFADASPEWPKSNVENFRSLPVPVGPAAITRSSTRSTPLSEPSALAAETEPATSPTPKPPATGSPGPRPISTRAGVSKTVRQSGKKT